MDPLLLVLVLAAAALIGWYVIARRRPVIEEDTWVLPPEDGSPAPRPVGPPAAGGVRTETLDRDALVRRDRAFDPAAWDNTPDAPGTTQPEEQWSAAAADDPSAAASARPSGAVRPAGFDRPDGTPPGDPDGASGADRTPYIDRAFLEQRARRESD